MRKLRLPALVARHGPVALFAFLLTLATAVPAHASILDRLLPWFSNSLVTQGLEIHFNGSLTARTIGLKDTKGVYATFDKVDIVWSPLALVHGRIKVDKLTAAAGDLARMPVSSGKSSSGGVKNLDLGKLEIDRFTLERPVTGETAVLKITGSGHLHGADMSGEVTADRLDAPGTYHLDGSKSAGVVKLILAAHEAPGGLISAETRLPDIGPIALDATVAGPETALATTLTLTAGELRAKAGGTINLTDKTIPGLQIVASAPAMSPRPDLSWSSVAVTADASGPFATPSLKADIKIAALKAGTAGARLIALTAQGNEGDIRLAGSIDGLVIPGKAPDVLAASPVQVVAEAKLKAPTEPVTFSLTHPLLRAEGHGSLKEEQATLHLTLPDLAPLAAAEGEQIEGHAALTMNGGRRNGAVSLAANGVVGITGGKAPIPALVGDAGRIDLAARVRGGGLDLTRFTVNGADVALSASGTASASAVDLRFAAGLPNVTPIQPKLAGGLKAEGRITGATTALAVDSIIRGDLSAEGKSSGPFTAHLVARGLPSAPRGTLTAEGSLLSSPIDVALAASRSADGAYHLAIQKADWKSLTAAGTLALPAGATLPVGNLTLQIGDLSDFSAFVGKPLTGSAQARLNAGTAVWEVRAEAENTSVPGTAALKDATLHLALDHPEHDPVIDGDLVLAGLKTTTIAGTVHMTASGPESALALTARANLSKLNGAPATLNTAGLADIPARGLRLNTLTAAWKGQNARLLAPVQFRFANGVTIDNLRVGLRAAVIRVNGHVGSTLDLTASAADVPANLAALVFPTLELAGTVNADAHIAGTPSAPNGTIHARASGLRLLTGKEAGLPPANLTAAVDLLGGTARLNVAAHAGASHLAVTGRAGLSIAAPLDLHATGVLEVATADALLAPNERAAGRVALAANITGTAAKPAGTVRVDARGVRLLTGPAAGLPPAALIATATITGDTARIDSRLTAGASYVTVAGTAGTATNAPLDLRAAGKLDLAIANPILLANGEAAEGTLALDSRIRGTLDSPQITGGATLANGDVRDYTAGVHLTDIAARLVGSGGTLRLVSLTARAGNGTITGAGTVGVSAPGIPVNITINAAKATPVSGDLLTATVNANLRIAGELENTVTLGGRVFVAQATIQVPNKLPISVVVIPVRIAGRPPPKPKPPSKLLADFRMNLTVAAPEKIFIRGRGLNVELGGTIHIAGTTTRMVPSGNFKLVRGSFNLVGNTLDFTSGDIDFNGAAITNPALHLVATSVGANMVATLTVGGTAQAPTITLASTPELPQDQILAQLLFHTNASLSPFQLAGIAAGIAQITGAGGGIASPLTGLQNALGLDQLGITTGPNGQPALQAGRYIGRRVFVGAQEATGGTGAQAKVQVNLTKRLKLNATAGSGETTNVIGATGESTGATVGLTYQFEY